MVISEIPSVKLKGVGDGFWVTITPESPEETIYKEIVELFERLKHLAINAKVVLDIGNAQGYDNLLNNIKLLLKSRFDVGNVTEPPQKNFIHSEVNRQNIASINPYSSMIGKGWINDRSDALILAGRVRSGQKIETKGHLIIAGNVNPGAQLTAAGNIIVLGSLQGQVYAGYPDDEDAFVIALDFKTPNIQIGGIIHVELNSSLTGKTVFATVQDGKIILEDYLKLQPFGKIPWPTIM
ncbi:MAG: septum site-determining protein MinC [Desulfamplus sp.]|nr:septum site-determining protein MinC [Desulfamplus sp.]